MTNDLILTVALTCVGLSGITAVVLLVREIRDIRHERNGTTPKE